MIIEKQPVISWLLTNNINEFMGKLGPAGTNNFDNYTFLYNSFQYLADIRASMPNWGLPEFVMPSFEEKMRSGAKLFFNVDHTLFQLFSESNTKGILLSKQYGTLVYSFKDNVLSTWLFQSNQLGSSLYMYFTTESTENNHRKLYVNPLLLGDTNIFAHREERFCEFVSNFIISYLAIKYFAPKEYITLKTIGNSETTALEIENQQYHPTKIKITNNSGQDVMVMDSSWFREIVGTTKVRGFMRLYHMKDDDGNHYTELKYIPPHDRNYTRRAKIDSDINKCANI